MREPNPSISLGHQLLLFYRVDGKCTELALLSDKTEKDGDYSVECKYMKVFLNLTSNSKNLLNPSIFRILTNS